MYSHDFLRPRYRLPHFRKKIKQRLLAAFIFCNPKMPVLTIWRLAMLRGWPHSGFCLPLTGGLTSAEKYWNPLCHNVGSKIRKIVEHSRNYNLPFHMTYYTIERSLFQSIFFYFPGFPFQQCNRSDGLSSRFYPFFRPVNEAPVITEDSPDRIQGAKAGSA